MFLQRLAHDHSVRNISEILPLSLERAPDGNQLLLVVIVQHTSATQRSVISVSSLIFTLISPSTERRVRVSMFST